MAQPNNFTQHWVNPTFGQPHNFTQPNNNPTSQPNNLTTDATPNQTCDVTNKNGDVKAYVLEEGTAVGTDVRKANKNVAMVSQQKQKPLPTKSKTHGVIWASGGEEYDENYDVYEHLDKVPITMPPSLGPPDYMYNPYRCNVIFNAPQDSTNLPSTCKFSNFFIRTGKSTVKDTTTAITE